VQKYDDFLMVLTRPTVCLGWIDHPQIGRLLFSATSGVIFSPKVALSPPAVSEPLNASFRLKIAPVVPENKSCPIFACQIWQKKMKINLLTNYILSLLNPLTCDLCNFAKYPLSYHTPTPKCKPPSFSMIVPSRNSFGGYLGFFKNRLVNSGQTYSKG
jgi:hypothetical protein